MKKIALVSSESVHGVMAGIGIRFHQMASYLAGQDFKVSLFCPERTSETESIEKAGFKIKEFNRDIPGSELDEFDVVIAQGHYASLIAESNTSTPVVFDLCDPYLIENLAYHDEYSGEIYVNDRKEWRSQLLRGDYFLCATEGQKLFNLGWMMALDRFDPNEFQDNPTLSEVFRMVPSGVPEEIPDYRPLLPAKTDGIFRVLFGGIYDWYDPWTAVRAVEHTEGIQVVFVASPNPEQTPQRLFNEIHDYCQKCGYGSDRFLFIDWAPFDRRFDLVREVDLLAAPHVDSVETQLSLRSRYLEAMSVGCPVISTDGGEVAEIVRRIGGGLVVPHGEPHRLLEAIDSIQRSIASDSRAYDVSETIRQRYAWPRVLRPLSDICRNPERRNRPIRCVAHHVQPESSRPGDEEVLFSVVLPTFNRMDILPEVIDSLENQKQAPGFELIVVNDGSSDGTGQWLSKRSFVTRTRIIETANQGPANARSEALGLVSGSYVVLLGDDMVPDPFWLRNHYQAHKQRGFDANLAVIGHTDWHRDTRRSRFLDFLDSTGWQFGFDKIEDPENVTYNFFYGSNLSMRSALLKEHGFNKSFRYPAWEDIELGYRLSLSGLRIVYEAGARVAHSHQTSVARFTRRHWKTGYSAVGLCRLHPELQPLALPDGRSFRNAQSGFPRYVRFLLARILEPFPISIPDVWNLVLRDSYVSGVREALSDDGYECDGESTPQLLPLNFSGNSPLLKHATGRVDGERWLCEFGKHRAGRCVYGPYYEFHESRKLKVTFNLDFSDGSDCPVQATVDVYDGNNDAILSARHIKDVSGPLMADIEFDGCSGQLLEFRIFWHGKGDLAVNSITLDRRIPNGDRTQV